jgi:hypothetical protein
MSSDSSQNSEAKNASGLTASQSKALQERNVEPNEEKIISSIKEVRCRFSDAFSKLRYE